MHQNPFKPKLGLRIIFCLVICHPPLFLGISACIIRPICFLIESWIICRFLKFWIKQTFAFRHLRLCLFCTVFTARFFDNVYDCEKYYLSSVENLILLESMSSCFDIWGWAFRYFDSLSFANGSHWSFMFEFVDIVEMWNYSFINTIL